MKDHEKAKIKQLDVNGMNGTIQHLLMNPNINQMPYVDAIYYLLHKTLDERAYYEKIYQKFFNVITSAGLMSNELLELEEKL